MENKKLVEILLKDMSELEELISEVKNKGNFDLLEMEFIHTRVRGLMQLLKILDNKEVDGRAGIVSHQKTKEFRELAGEEKAPDKLKTAADEQKNLHDKRDSSHEKQESASQEKSIEPEESLSAGEKQPAAVNEENNKEDHSIPQKEEPEVQEDSKDRELEDDNEMLMEESDKPEGGSRLGDSFLKGKSVNDLITEKHKLEFKLSNRPVSSIRAAIGINDRFQYIRELFDNDTQKFLDTVETLDSMGHIKEAVDYLRQNFKWKKNETSLKFVNLVKRRFQKSTDN